MKTIDEITKILKEHKTEVAKKFNVRAMGVFGSYVRNEQTAGSDLDVLVEFEKPVGLFKFMDLEEYLQGIVGIKIDLVSRKALKPYIGRNILAEIKPI